MKRTALHVVRGCLLLSFFLFGACNYSGNGSRIGADTVSLPARDNKVQLSTVKAPHVIWVHDSTFDLIHQFDTAHCTSIRQLDMMVDELGHDILRDRITIKADSLAAFGRIQEVLRLASENDLGKTVLQIDP